MPRSTTRRARPGLCGAGALRLGPLVVVRARDMYAEGTGRMLVKVASLWPVADASGAQTDQAAMMRYLSEMIWFPTDFVAKRYRAAGASDPETWSTPITGYGEFEGLLLPTRG